MANVVARRLRKAMTPQEVKQGASAVMEGEGLYQLTKDKAPDEHFRKLGFNILRFWNSDVDRNLSGVLEMIDSELRSATPTRPRAARASTFPLRGRD